MDHDSLPPIKRRVAFVHGYGNFLMLWSTFEILMEILIMKQLRIKPREASIICAPLGAGAKKNLLVSLLNRHSRKNKVGIILIKEAIGIAARNDFAHGFFREHRPTAEYGLIHREVKDKYRPRYKPYTSKIMEQQARRFETKFQEIQKYFEVSDNDINAYTKPIQGLALALEARGKRRRIQHPSSS